MLFWLPAWYFLFTYNSQPHFTAKPRRNFFSPLELLMRPKLKCFGEWFWLASSALKHWSDLTIFWIVIYGLKSIEYENVVSPFSIWCVKPGRRRHTINYFFILHLVRFGEENSWFYIVVINKLFVFMKHFRDLLFIWVAHNH